MGTWDAGNFDNDEALDFVGDMIDQLQGRIDGWFAGDNPSIDDGGEGEIMPSVAIMQILAEHCSACPPKAEEVSGWKERYLKLYDSQIDALGADTGYKKKRRQTIEQTFKRLEAQAGNYWNGGAARPASEVAPAATPATTSTVSPQKTGVIGEFRRFEFTSEKSSKFWRIKKEGNSFTVNYGRIGTAGQSKTKEFPSEQRAQSEYEKLIDEKVSKGYEEVDDGE